MRFYESLFLLKRSYENIIDMGELMWDFKLTHAQIIGENHKKSVHYLALFNHSILEICSFMEEYDKYLVSTSEVEFKQRILDFRAAAEPAINKVKEWEDLRAYRNEMIAHPWRRGKQKVFSYPNLLIYNVPKSYMQLQYCRFYLGIVVHIMEFEFQNELIAMSNYIMNMGHEWLAQKAFGTPYEDMEGAINKINQILIQQNKNYAIDPLKFLEMIDEIRPNHI